MNDTDRSDERSFTAGDVREAAGLSSRQLNDWDQRRALPEDWRRGEGWRRFSPREVFFLMIASELRRRFGVPVERLGFVREFMLQDGADHLRAAADLMARLGVGVWLLTDLKETFILDSELEFLDLMEHDFFGGEHDSAFLWIKVNPLVNRLLGCLKEPVRIRAHGRGYEILREVREKFGVTTPDEFEVLQLLRSGDYDKVEIALKDGKARTVRAGRHVPEPERQDLAALVQEHGYQTLKVTTRDGRVVAIEQTVPKKRGASRT